MAYFPLFVSLEGKEMLVVGGGTIATRRVKALLDFGCNICVVSPEVSEEMKDMIKNGSVKWICDSFENLEQISMNAAQPFFVLAAANSEVNQKVVEECRKAGILVNDASRKENCDFYFPGLVKDGDVVVGITAGGKDHKLASAITSEIRSVMQKSETKKPVRLKPQTYQNKEDL